MLPKSNCEQLFNKVQKVNNFKIVNLEKDSKVLLLKLL